MSEPALQLNDFNTQDLRDVADRLLETTKVEYVDEGVLLVMNPPGIEHCRIVHGIIDATKKAYYTGKIAVDWETLPPPLEFTLPTADWPRWLA